MNSIIKEDINKIINNLSFLKELNNKTILITGANGMLPAYMVETLLSINLMFSNRNVKVLALVRNKKKALNRFDQYKNDKNFIIIEQDVSDHILINEKIDFIIHAASQASPKYYSVDPVGTLSANVIGTINIMKLALEKKVESVLFFSSSEVYGQLSEKDMPISESTFGQLDPTIVRSCYAESKRMGENICVSWSHQYSIPVKIVRPFHTYGPGMQLDDGRIFADFADKVLKKQNIILNSDGLAKRSFCYISDATEAFFRVLFMGENANAYNIGNPEQEFTMYDFAKIITNIFPEDNLSVLTNIPNNTSNYLKSTVARNQPDITKIKKLGWSPNISVKEGFTRLIKSFSN